MKAFRSKRFPQLRAVFLNAQEIWQHLESLGCHGWRQGAHTTITSGGWKPEMLLDIVRCTAQPPSHKDLSSPRCQLGQSLPVTPPARELILSLQTPVLPSLGTPWQVTRGTSHLVTLALEEVGLAPGPAPELGRHSLSLFLLLSLCLQFGSPGFSS